MKAKYYIGILSALLLSGMPVKAQYPDNPYHSNGGATVIVNNYYDGNDYYYSSRINRFHRSYVAFEYYSPVFTSNYWYGYTPFSWGVSIYNGGFGFNLGYNFYNPVYYGNTCYFDYGWNDPFWYNYNSWGYSPYSITFYEGYDPFFYSSWYGSYAFHINHGPMWAHNYTVWNGHNNFHNKGWNDKRPDINTRSGYDKDMNRQPENRRSTNLTAARITTINNQAVSTRIMSQPSERTTAMNNLPENRRNYSQPANRSTNMDQPVSRNEFSDNRSQNRNDAAPAHRESTLQQNSGSVQRESRPSSEGASRSVDNGRRK